MVNIAKRHHTIPKVYLKRWCITGQTVQRFLISKSIFKNGNIDHLFIKNNYNTYKAGGINNPKKVNEFIFSSLLEYNVEYNCKKLIIVASLIGYLIILING